MSLQPYRDRQEGFVKPSPALPGDGQRGTREADSFHSNSSALRLVVPVAFRLPVAVLSTWEHVCSWFSRGDLNPRTRSVLSAAASHLYLHAGGCTVHCEEGSEGSSNTTKGRLHPPPLLCLPRVCTSSCLVPQEIVRRKKQQKISPEKHRGTFVSPSSGSESSLHQQQRREGRLVGAVQHGHCPWRRAGAGAARDSWPPLTLPPKPRATCRLLGCTLLPVLSLQGTGARRA